ncbi:MAG: hypothetical protein ABSC32_00035 [Steroidobacteraceae bacterium]|jgi:hypothetical protein
MRIKTGLSVLAGAVALACSGGAFAQTTTNATSAGTVILNIVDQTNGTSFVFDTGLSVNSFADPTSYSLNIANDPASSAVSAAYAAFVAGEGSGDTLDYSVVGAAEPGAAGVYATTLTTAVSKPTTIAGNKGSDAAAQIGTFLGQVNNPLGSATYNGTSAIAIATWNNGGYEGNLQADLGGISDNAALNTSLAFYAVTTTNQAGLRNGASVSTFTGSWDLTSAGLLTYTEPGGGTSPVPLPTPLLLMLSGLGLMGLVARRGQPGSKEAPLNGAAA